MNIFAHRGYSMLYPENTLQAFRKALEYGCHGIECDVQLTGDNQIVILHDETIDRLSNGKGYVKDFTYEELTKFNFGRPRPRAGEFHRLPRLADLLELLKDGHENIILNIELKNSEVPYPGLEEMVLAEVAKYDLPNEIIYSSFNHDSIKYLNRMNPDLKTAPLIGRRRPDLIDYVKSLGSKGVHTALGCVDEISLKKVLEAGLFINIYTINDINVARKLKQHGVSGIFTDSCREFMEGL